jgi:ankyrin repeat protein
LIGALTLESGEGLESKLRAALQQSPQLANMTDSNGWTLLHYAAINQSGASGARMVQLLHQANSQAALSPTTKYGYLPLHNAASKQGGAKGTAVVEALLRAEPKAATVADKDGNLPLHRAAYWQGVSSTSHLERLSLLTPRSLFSCDAGGDKGVAVAELLLQAYPEAASIKNKDNETPLGIALKHVSASDPLITLLMAGG